MIYYSTCIRGRLHIKNNKPCQDYKKVIELSNNYIVAAVADGVGTSKHSEVASKLAVNTAVKYIKNNFPIDPNEQNLKELILASFHESNNQIDFVVQRENASVYYYDTTLTLIIYDGSTVFYGHVGDSGAIGIKNSGDYINITTQQKGSDGISVIPLRMGESVWEIDYIEEICAVMLVTDGILDGLISPLIMRREEHPIYVNFVKDLLDLNFLQINKKNIKRFTKQVKLSLRNYKNINDDIAMVGIINEKVVPNKKEETYYEDPNWELLYEKIKYYLYPHLYKDDKSRMSID